ncbi:MAG: hypothetical protein GY778_17820 [bacterium]|nr:hypothetical protein [bacterium]
MKACPKLALSMATLAPILAGERAGAECAPFYVGLQDAASVTADGGLVTGSVGYTAAVNENGADFDGSGYITFSGSVFDAPRGSVSFWFRKNSADSAGGIAQIGALGQPNSIGLFYVNQVDLHFEMRGHDGTAVAVIASGVLSTTDWTHVVAVWNDRGPGSDMWLFIDGSYAGYQYLPATIVHSAGALQLGMTGYYGPGEGVADEVRFFDWSVSDDEVYAEYVFSSGRFVNQPTAKPPSTGTVQLAGKSLLVNGRPFRIKGVGYQPTPIGYPIERWVLDYIYTDPGILARDLTLLRGMNVNTIRLWSEAPDTTLLDACYGGGVDPIYVIMGFWVAPSSGVDYGDPGTITAIENSFRNYVAQFKNHPAVLAWGIGNENNLAYQGDPADWYALANRLAEVAYIEEGAAYHPTVVINGGMRHFGNIDLGSDDASLGFADMWGHNAYPGDEFHCYFDYYDRLSAKPLVLTEYGIDAYNEQTGGEYPTVHADYVVQQWRQMEAATTGGTVMAYSDEWWKAGAPSTHDPGGYATSAHPDGFSNEEWWGLVRPQDDGGPIDVMYPREAYYALGAEYADVAGDYDTDDDTDLQDFAALQRCFGATPDSACEAAFDFEVDGQVDLSDLDEFEACLNGPTLPPACAP